MAFVAQALLKLIAFVTGLAYYGKLSGAASPAGDAHPPLLAACARVEAESVRGTRLIPADEFYTGVKRNALEPDELIKGVQITPPAGPQQFCKIGTRKYVIVA